MPSDPIPDLSLRRWPDVEADNLFATDSADRLILDEVAGVLAEPAPAGSDAGGDDRNASDRDRIASAGDRSARAGGIVVIGDNYGALTLGAIDRFGATAVRVHQDRLVGEQALDANAADLGLSGYQHHGLDPALVIGARVILLRLPRSLDALDEIAGLIARHSAPGVTVFGGGRIKHLTTAMNEVLLRHFGRLDISHARQKARVLVAAEPLTAAASAATETTFPQRQFHPDLDLWVCAHGGAFASTRVDIGTRFLLSVTNQMMPDAASAIDLGSGTGVLAAMLAKQRPTLRIIATDQSSAAVASTRATAVANGVDDRITVVRDSGLASQPDGSADLILLNPPFHVESTVHLGEALRLFEASGRVLRPGGELWTVFNSHLGYRSTLSRVVGPTRQVARNAKFMVMVSTRPA